MFSHGLGCDMAHQTVSRWVSLPWNQPTIMVHFDPKMGIFGRPLSWKWHLERGKMASNHLPLCIRKLIVHFEFKVRINVVGRAKNLPK